MLSSRPVWTPISAQSRWLCGVCVKDGGQTIRELCREEGILPEHTLREALDPMSMTEPQG